MYNRTSLNAAIILMLSSLTGVANAQLGVGSRALGMGGAYTAVADDVSSQYWNPAGLANIRHFGLELFNTQLSLSGAGNFNDLLNHFPSDTNSQIAFAKKVGTGISTGEASGQIGFAFPNFALSVIPMARGVLTPRNSTGGIGLSYINLNGQSVPYNSTATLVNTYGYEVVGSLSRRLSKSLSLGLSLKYQNVTPNTVSIVFPEDTVQSGILSPTVTTTKKHSITSFGADLGAQYTVDKNWALGAMLRNFVATTDSNLLNGPTLTVGAAYKATKRVTLAADVADMGYPVHLNAGVEWRFPRVGALRAGVYRGHPTVGLGLFNVVNVAVATDSTLVSLSTSY